jgi:hypothetical protein
MWNLKFFVSAASLFFTVRAESFCKHDDDFSYSFKEGEYYRTSITATCCIVETVLFSNPIITRKNNSFVSLQRFRNVYKRILRFVHDIMAIAHHPLWRDDIFSNWSNTQIFLEWFVIVVSIIITPTFWGRVTINDTISGYCLCFSKTFHDDLYISRKLRIIQ